MSKPNSVEARRRLFAEAIAAGKSGVDAARSAGFKGSPETLAVTASQQLRNPKVQALLADARKASTTTSVATAVQLKEFWTRIVTGQEKDQGRPARLSERIKAAELLGKTQGMFVDRSKQEGELLITIRRGTDAAAALPPKETTK